MIASNALKNIEITGKVLFYLNRYASFQRPARAGALVN